MDIKSCTSGLTSQSRLLSSYNITLNLTTEICELQVPQFIWEERSQISFYTQKTQQHMGGREITIEFA